MERRTFTRTCLLCVGGAMLPPLLSGCQSTYYTQGVMERDGISVSRSEFDYLKKDQPMTRQYIIVRNDRMAFPICLYRFSDSGYAALLMKCTHKGSELNASGDHLHCPSHGSEFDNQGRVTQGPAEENLRSFRVTTDGEKIFIDLRV
ncbi:MAG: Rieske (2Fe-2S) protein [Bacteroidota bacterium]|nr:Rieske (2Fe-2S) protein [Bacteroidota bacterium]